MKYEIFAIHDVKANAFMRPFFLPNVSMATRTFSDIVADPQSDIYKNPADYTLFHLGSFDDANAKITPVTETHPIEALVNGVEVKSKIVTGGIE